jgi:hypothetical protein
VHGYANPLIMLMLAKLMESPKLEFGHFRLGIDPEGWV